MADKDKNQGDLEKQLNLKVLRKFAFGIFALCVGMAVLFMIFNGPQDQGTPTALRKSHELNEKIWRKLFKSSRLSPTFPRSEARIPKVNGLEGMSDGFDPSTWKLQVLNEGKVLELNLEDIKKLPKVEMSTELRCIEGWSEVVFWGGASFSDFMEAYHLPKDKKYVAFITPDEGYYVSIDMESALHSQTLLGYEMDGKPLTLDHGAPLRLVIPLKYGIKNIKRIGTIFFSDIRPKDFWTEQGYDWYAGH